MTTEKVLKWVGAITAVLSLLFGVQKLVQTVAENNDRERQIAELTQVASTQRQAGDYAAAWDSLAAAQKSAESGGALARMIGRLDAKTLEVRTAREDLAMEWLRNIRVRSGQTFSDIVAKVLPALSQGEASAQGARKADLLAHTGWAYFLRRRDGNSDSDPQRLYDAALQADPANPYAHAFAGHWTLWRRGSIETAQQHFTAALASGREKAFVRDLQLAALRNRGPDGDVPYVTVVAEMTKSQEEVSADARHQAAWVIQRVCRASSDDDTARALKAAAPTETLQSIYVAAYPDSPPAARDACLARLK